MSADGPQAAKGFVESESEVEDFTDDESVQLDPSSVESESAVEITNISQGDESDVPRKAPPRYTKSVRWKDENGVSMYEQIQTHGIPSRSYTYKKTAHPSRQYKWLREAWKWILRIMKWAVYAVLGFFSLAFTIGFFSTTLELVGDDIRRVVCTATLAPYLSVCNPPSQSLLSQIQGNIRAQFELVDVQSIFKLDAELPGILTSAQFAAESIAGAVRNNLHPSEER